MPQLIGGDAGGNDGVSEANLGDSTLANPAIFNADRQATFGEEGGGNFESFSESLDEGMAGVIPDINVETNADGKLSGFSVGKEETDSGDTEANDANGKKEGMDAMKGMQFLAANGKGMAELSEDDFTMAAKEEALQEIERKAYT